MGSVDQNGGSVRAALTSTLLRAVTRNPSRALRSVQENYRLFIWPSLLAALLVG
jgi:hypothetical protein